MVSPSPAGLASWLLLLAWVPATYLLLPQLREELRRCANCGKRGTTQKVDERIMGIFPSWEPEEWVDGDNLPRKGKMKTVYYKKLRIRYKCNSCGHEWEIVAERKV